MCLCVCVSKNQKNQRGTKKKSVEHGDLKIKINSGFQNSLEFGFVRIRTDEFGPTHGPTRVYEVRIRTFVLTDHPE